MLPVFDSSTTVAVAADFSPDYSSSSNFILKDGRKIYVGDCALFKPPQDSPPFIGIIRKLITGKEERLSLGVNWLYRPSDIKLGKGAFLEAAPNEIFYSFHKDEIPAASLLHPCKVAFLRKGVELPSGISSFVCRRVYDIENTCLWWLTDKDYINERQEEVDKLLDKTRLEMHGAVPSGGRSPKPLNGPTSALKPNSDTAQNSTSFSSQGKVKKRERSDQVSEPAKRERLSKPEDRDFGQNRTEHVFKSELAKITDKGGLVDLEGVERLVQLMQSDSTDKKIDLAGRIMLVDVIAVTDRVDCLGRFVQLRGLPVLDEWLQEVHKGKIGDGTSSKDNDKSVEEFLLTLLRALDKLPVNLDALQSCNMGRSVNHLRTHKNSEVQKKARSLVDTWKKRVEAEMNMNDSKTGSSRGVSWPTKPAPSEVSHVGSRKPGASADGGFRISVTQSLSSKSSQVKLAAVEGVAKSSSPGGVKSMTTQVSRMLIGPGTSDPPLTPIKEERSSSSSQSQNNSQSCSSEHAKTVGSSCREDARSSTTGSVTVSRGSTGASRHQKSNHGVHASVASVAQKEVIAAKVSSGNRSSNSDKVSPTRVSHDRVPDISNVDHGNNQRLIVRLPHTNRSPSRGASGSSLDDLAAISGRTSPSPEKHDNNDKKARGRGEISRCNNLSSGNSNLCQGKDGQHGHEEGNAVTASAERQKIDEEGSKVLEESKATDSLLGTVPRLGKPYDASLSSINALVESCAKISEANASTSPEDDDVGMNLLASVAAGEILKADTVSPSTSHRSSPVAEESSSGDDGKLEHMVEEAGKIQCKPSDVTDAGPIAEVLDSVDSLLAKKDLGHTADKMLKYTSGDCRVPLVETEDKEGKSSFTNLQQSGEVSCLRSDVKSIEPACDPSVVGLPIVQKVEIKREVEAVHHSLEHRISVSERDQHNFISVKSEGGTAALNDERKADCGNERVEESSVAAVSELTVTDAKCGKEVNEKPTCSSLEVSLQKHNATDHDSRGGVSTEQKPSENVDIQLDSSDRKSDHASLPSPSGMSLVEHMAKVPDKSRTEGHVELNERPWTGLVSSDSDHNIECTAENLDRKDVRGASASHMDLPIVSLQKNEPCEISMDFKSDGVESDAIIEPHASVANASVSVAYSAGSVKLDFDLNEGFSIDDGNQSEPAQSVGPDISSTIHLPCPLPIPLSSMSGTLSTSITVAAAAKGPFVLPENPLRTKGELGWKGSAATSAFRPAEPRKNLEMGLNFGETSMVDASGKQGRTPLDFDLNIPDERVLEDVISQNSARASCSESGARDRSDGGFDLDLNKADDSSDTGFLSNNSSRFEISTISNKSSLPGGLSNGALNISRGFDLNNGPGLDEVAPEAAPHNQSVKSSLPFPSPVPGLRMSSAEFGNFSSWYLPANTYSAISVPSVFPGRAEHSFVAPAGSQRILAPPNASTTFGPEIYRGSVLSSSPAVPFTATTPFQYPGFPFETSFPLASNTFSGASTAYMESSSGNALCFPTVPSQLVGPACVVSSPYPRQYAMSLPGGSTNASSDSRKWGGQLDLNAGPGVSDGERREERLPSAIRQHTLPGSQVMTEEQMKMYQVAGGAGNSVFKRKDPDGGWETSDRFHSFRQSSWQ
ncbi:hypothetical protein K2173_019900 [Erythroxylum novogranatense]|uniref:Uncharacterized protein n=1 Tax=Erythroxylum novogranatense TaxID=1862640 RepID=A0AAV8U6F9_9ROSI|nr:hypothetical protein K2173_019900 [Erythroxylum novogranatense]